MTNLLTPQEKRLVRTEYRVRVMVVALIFLFFTIFFAVTELLPSYFYSSVSKVIAENEFEISKVDALADTDVVNSFGEVGAVLRFVSTQETQGIQSSNLIKEVLESKPEGVVVEKFSFEESAEGRVLVVAGEAESRSDLIQFSNNLGAGSSFSSVDVPAGNLAQTRNISFDITLAGNF